MSSLVDRARRSTTLRKEVFRRGDVLDIGCGDYCRGSLAVDIAPADGADLLTDGTRLPFRDASFDGVVSYHVIEHLRRPAVECLLDEIARVLRPGGRAHLLVDRDRSRAALLVKDPTHVERYDPGEIRDIVSARFEIDVFQTHNLVGNVHNHPLSWWRLLGERTKVYVEGVAA